MSKKKAVQKNTVPKLADTKKHYQKTSVVKQGGSINQRRLVFLALVTTTFVSFYPSLKSEFTNWDALF